MVKQFPGPLMLKRGQLSLLIVFISAAAMLQSCCPTSFFDPGACRIRQKPALVQAPVNEIQQVENKITAYPSTELDIDALTTASEIENERPAIQAIESKVDHVSIVINERKLIVPSSLLELEDSYSPARKMKLPKGVRSIGTSIIAGPNISFKSNKEDYGSGQKYRPGVGFQVGVGSIIDFNDKWSLMPAILVKQNNATEERSFSEPGDGNEPPVNYNMKDKYSYTWLSAPILAEYKLSDQFSIVGGPEVNYLLGASVKSDNGYTGGDNKESLTSNSVKFGLDAQLGLKYTLPAAHGAWGIQLLYDHRISRINKKESEYGGGYEPPAWHMKSVQLSVTCAICNLLKK